MDDRDLVDRVAAEMVAARGPAVLAYLRAREEEARFADDLLSAAAWHDLAEAAAAIVAAPAPSPQKRRAGNRG